MSPNLWIAALCMALSAIASHLSGCTQDAPERQVPTPAPGGEDTTTAISDSTGTGDPWAGSPGDEAPGDSLELQDLWANRSGDESLGDTPKLRVTDAPTPAPKGVHTTTAASDCLCPEIFDPVCGLDCHTYSNDCKASCSAGGHLLSLGGTVGSCEEGCYEECGCATTDATTPAPEGVRTTTVTLELELPVTGAPKPTPEDVHTTTTGPSGCLCPEIYEPVCGLDCQTYSNACFAGCSAGGHALSPEGTAGPCEEGCYEACGCVIGRPYKIGGVPVAAAAAAAREGAAAGGEWGSPGGAGLSPRAGGLAARLAAEGARAAGALLGPEALEELLAVGGIASLPEEELERLVRRAVQELSASAAAYEERLGWHAAGLSEHASVGSFARLALELMVAGAPPRLARLAARAQDEEVLHAHVSLALGGAGGGGERLEFPEHDLQLRRDLAALGDAAVSEGLQGEGRAALKLFGQASAALAGGRPALGRLCWAMGLDEAGHAELAAETLEWLRRAAGATPPAVEVAGGGVRVVELRQVEAVM